MAENIPPNDLPGPGGPPPAESGDSPPEPDSPSNSSITTSTRALRGSPTPTTSSLLFADTVPDPFSSSSSQPSYTLHSSVSASSLQPSLPDVPSAPPVVITSPSESGTPAPVPVGVPCDIPAPPLPDRVSDLTVDRPGSPSSIAATVGTVCTAHPSDPAGVQADSSHLAVLIDLGFEEPIGRLALIRTANAGVEAAVQWIVERSNESDFEDDDGEESDEDNEVEVMGGAVSAPLSLGGGRTHKMVLVANTSLKMGTGKLAAQVGHATLAVYRSASTSEEGKAALEAWRRHGEVKIVVKGESTEQLMDLFKNAKDQGLFAYIVQDAGYTQIPPGSRTVLGVFGPVAVVDAVTGHLKLL